MIRLCTVADKDVWKQMNEEFMRFEYEEDNVWEDPLAKGNPVEIFNRIVSDPRSSNRLFMVEEDGETIGFMNTAVFESVWAHGRVLFLDDFFIREAYQGRGLGKKALKDLEEFLGSEEFVRIQLMAEDTNPRAVRFYETENYSKQKINFFCKYL